MGQTFIVNLDVAGHRIPATSWNWGMAAHGEARSAAPSYGTEIEVPAVIELLELVVAGAVSAKEASDCLNRIATAINEKMDAKYSQYLTFDDEPASGRMPPTQSPSEPPALDERWVYAVSSEDDPKAIKIGVARDINQRIRSLQIGSASPIVLRWSERGGFPLERHLHEVFDHQRISGEWFDFRQHGNPQRAIKDAARAFLAQFERSTSQHPD